MTDHEKELTPRQRLIREINERRKTLHSLTKQSGFGGWSFSIRRYRGLPWSPLPALELHDNRWVIGKNGVIYVAAPDASLYIPVHLPGMEYERLVRLKDALIVTATALTGGWL